MTESLKLIALCTAAALVCISIRSMHPQMAAAIALACGAGVMLTSMKDLSAIADVLRRLDQMGNGASLRMLKLTGIAILAEFASDLCRDAGETAIAKRIDMGVRLGICAAAIPSLLELTERISGMLE